MDEYYKGRGIPEMFGWLRPVFIFHGLLLLAFSAHAEVQTPAHVLETFYAWVLEHQSAALPSAEQRSTLSAVLSPQLVNLLKEASETEERCIKVAQIGEKPYVFEGDLFVGRYEGATEISYGKLSAKGARAKAEIDLMYVDPTFPKAHKYRASVWKNRVEMSKQGERWLIRNISFENNGSLVSVLREYLAEGKRSCRIKQ